MLRLRKPYNRGNREVLTLTKGSSFRQSTVSRCVLAEEPRAAPRSTCRDRSCNRGGPLQVSRPHFQLDTGLARDPQIAAQGALVQEIKEHGEGKQLLPCQGTRSAMRLHPDPRHHSDGGSGGAGDRTLVAVSAPFMLEGPADRRGDRQHAGRAGFRRMRQTPPRDAYAWWRRNTGRLPPVARCNGRRSWERSCL